MHQECQTFQGHWLNRVSDTALLGLESFLFFACLFLGHALSFLIFLFVFTALLLFFLCTHTKFYYKLPCNYGKLCSLNREYIKYNKYFFGSVWEIINANHKQNSWEKLFLIHPETYFMSLLCPAATGFSWSHPSPYLHHPYFGLQLPDRTGSNCVSTDAIKKEPTIYKFH